MAEPAEALSLKRKMTTTWLHIQKIQTKKKGLNKTVKRAYRDVRITKKSLEVNMWVRSANVTRKIER